MSTTKGFTGKYWMTYSLMNITYPLTKLPAQLIESLGLQELPKNTGRQYDSSANYSDTSLTDQILGELTVTRCNPPFNPTMRSIIHRVSKQITCFLASADIH